MRILYHHRTQAEDAQGVHIYEMIGAFRELGHEVDLVALVTLDEKREKKVRGGGWEWLALRVPNLFYEMMELAYNVFGYLRLRGRIRKRRPDLIYERYSLNTFCGIWAGRRFGIPIVLEVNAPLSLEQQRLGKLTFKALAAFSERWICSNATRTVVVSEQMKEILIREGVKGEKLAVIPNGINPKEFHPEISGEEVRRRYGLEGKIVIGFVGWFRPWHGLEMLLEIMSEERLADQSVRLLLVGDGPAFPDLHAYAKGHDLLSAVVFTGPVKRREMGAHIAAMDIAVQPSANEYACPMKIFEYMGMGKCIVAPDQANLREILEDRMNAFLFRPADRAHLKSVLLNAIRDREGRRSMGARAYSTIDRRRYLWSANAEKTLDLVFGAAASRKWAGASRPASGEQGVSPR